jgi:SAM-dependent methyltransferase
MPEATSPAAAGGNWTDAYIRARRREGRVFPDELVAGLPVLPRDHALHREWGQRADSAARLMAYLQATPRRLTIADLGCGNGWLTHRLATIPGSQVIGIDTNSVEIEQARRVFGEGRNVTFVERDFLIPPLPFTNADVVVLAAVVQYVPGLAALLRAVVNALPPGGEVHVIDSPIYEPADVAEARDRTQRHYEAVGVPELAERYHHHTWRSLGPLRYDVLYRPDAVVRRLERRFLRRERSPFPWIRVRTDQNR